jgi:YD repeat-containing protein
MVGVASVSESPLPSPRSTGGVGSIGASRTARAFTRLPFGTLATIATLLGAGCAAAHATSTADVELRTSAPTSFPPLAWSSPHLRDQLPRDGCTFGGTTRRACRRGCVVRVHVRDDSGERDEEHRLSEARRVVVVRRSDGSVSGRANVSLEDESLDVFLESPRGAERGVSHVLERMRDPHALEEGEWLRRVLVQSRTDGTHTLAESGDARLSWRHEAWVTDEVDRRIEQRRTSGGEQRSETTSDARGGLQHRAWVVDERGAREVERRHELVRLDERGRVVELRQEGHHEGERWTRRRLRTYDARGNVVETVDEVVERGHAWRRRVTYDEHGGVITTNLEDLDAPRPDAAATRGLLEELFPQTEERGEVVERVTRRLDHELAVLDGPPDAEEHDEPDRDGREHEEPAREELEREEPAREEPEREELEREELEREELERDEPERGERARDEPEPDAPTRERPEDERLVEAVTSDDHDGRARLVVTRDAAGRVLAARDGSWHLRVVRDAAGRVRREVTPIRTLDRVYDERGRLVASRVRTVVRDDHESDARYAYEGACDDVEPPIVLGHEADADSPFAFTAD